MTHWHYSCHCVVLPEDAFPATVTPGTRRTIFKDETNHRVPSTSDKDESAHVAAFAKGMYCKGGNISSIDEPNTNIPVIPLYGLPFEKFWLQRDRGCDKVPPPKGEVLELPAGGQFMVELAHNRGQTTLSFGGEWTSDWLDGHDHPEDWRGENAGDCLSDGLMHAQTAAGTAFAISYNSDIT
ncbi:hypothetical protein B0T16DRAFT_456999 [Cercophora newfieldiana]|uniref:Uncharacterized protein n=1 Tax=Cercophora newfieldiana TaxID=92897 RepID=A0AA39YC60_9PEZI|nr:hypothetical protein B0T16DRAFT_456999 [Cercophora newfieldiana]